MELNPKVIEFLNELTEDQHAIVAYLRKHALQLADDIRQDVKWSALCFFSGDRPFAGIMPYRKYVSVIFDRGAELDDPHHVLEGKGRTMRHIKIHSFEDLENTHVGLYIEQSYKLDEEVGG